MPPAKGQWSPAQRRKFKATMKAKRANAKEKRNAAKETKEIRAQADNSSEALPGEIIVFAHGHILGWIEGYASRLSVPASLITHRVGELLRGEKVRR